MSRMLLLLAMVVVSVGAVAAEDEGPAPPEAPETELDRVLSGMQKAADDVKDLSADYTGYRFLADIYDSEEEAERKSGRLYFKKPEFVRIDQTKPYEKHFYVTPERFVEYLPATDVATVVRRDRTREREGTETLAIAMGTAPSKLRERFTLALVEDPDLSDEERQRLRVLQLTPKQDDLPEEAAEVTRVWLWIDTGDWLPRRVKSFERDQDYETFLFANVTTNQGLSERLFEFTPGPKTVIDDMTASPPPAKM